MELQHLQDIYQAESILTNCTPARGPSPCCRVKLSTHTALPGAPSTMQPQPCPVFLFSFPSPPPFLPVSQCGSGSEGYFTRPLWSANLSPTFGEFPQIGISWGAEQSAVRWPSPPPRSSTLSTLPYPTLQPPLPHPAGERFTQQFSSWSTALHLFPLLSLFISHICLSPSLQTMIPLREEGVDLNLRLTHQDFATFIFF